MVVTHNGAPNAAINVPETIETTSPSAATDMLRSRSRYGSLRP